MKKTLPVSKTCFACGIDNRAGLGLEFAVEDGAVSARWLPAEHHCGYHRTVHGGIVAAAFDETMAWAAAREFKRMCLTGELKVRYFQRTPGHKHLTVKARVIEPGKRRVVVHAVLIDDDGVEYADAQGKFAPLTPEETIQVDDNLVYRPSDERLFDELRKQDA